jgi:F-type H+-transporting ATPase subunit a
MTLSLHIPSLLAAGANPLGHVLDKPDKLPIPFTDYGLSMNSITLLVVTALFIWVMTMVAKAIAPGPEGEGRDRYVTKNRFAHMIEVVVVYLLENVIRPQLGPDAKRFTPFLLTLFFFILFNNLFGLIPLIDIQYLIVGLAGGEPTAWIGGTATGRLAVTAGLALTAFIIWNIHGIRTGGVGGWAHHFMGGGPWYLAPIMVPVEIMGTIVKPAALAVRLFANMTAGHVLLAVIIGFTAAAPAALGWLGAPITVIAAVGGVLIFFLEVFVAFLQAFIFMFLTTLFIAQLAHHHHDDHAGAEAYDAEHPAESDPAAPVTV